MMLKEEAKQFDDASPTKRTSGFIDVMKNNFNTKLTVENLCGEEIFVTTNKRFYDYQSIYPNQTARLEFDDSEHPLNKSTTEPANNYDPDNNKLKSPYRRDKFRIEHSTIEKGKLIAIRIPQIEALNKKDIMKENKHENEDPIWRIIDVGRLQKQK
jgi:hypothetical protein